MCDYSGSLYFPPGPVLLRITPQGFYGATPSFIVDFEIATLGESGLTFADPLEPGISHTLTIRPGDDLWETHEGGVTRAVATCEDR